MNKQFFIFTDGSAIGNPGPAGWAAIVIHRTKRQEISGSVSWSTVSEMELRAAVEALRLTPVGARIELRSDSELLINGMRFRVFRFQRIDTDRNPCRGFVDCGVRPLVQMTLESYLSTSSTQAFVR